jgi:hypothetical protein
MDAGNAPAKNPRILNAGSVRSLSSRALHSARAALKKPLVRLHTKETLRATMATRILFMGENADVFFTQLCESDRTAQMELQEVAEQFRKEGWQIDVDVNGGYSAVPPRGQKGMARMVRRIVLRRDA